MFFCENQMFALALTLLTPQGALGDTTSFGDVSESGQWVLLSGQQGENGQRADIADRLSGMITESPAFQDADTTVTPSTSGQADSSDDDELMSLAELMEQLKESEDISDLEIEVEEISADGDRRRWGAHLGCYAKYKASCKDQCASGWEHYGNSDWGCCKSFWSCGGHRKLCRHQIVCPYEYSAGGQRKNIHHEEGDQK